MKFGQKTTLCLVLFLFLAACSQSDHDLKEITVRMPIPFVESHALPFLAADALGFYTDEGLSVTLQPGTSEMNPVTAILSGADEIAYLGGHDTLLTARGKGAPLVALANVHQQSNFVGIMSLAEHNITSLQDLEGKRLGMFYGHISTDILRALLLQEGVTVEEVNVHFNFNHLIEGNIDAMFDFRTYGPLILEHKMGHHVNRIRPAEYGIHSYGYTIFTSEDFLEDDPETVEKFIHATMKGVRWVMENEDEAVSILLKDQPHLDYDYERMVTHVVDSILEEQYADGRPLGYMGEEEWKETYERLDKQGLIKTPFDVNDAYTTQFLSQEI